MFERIKQNMAGYLIVFFIGFVLGMLIMNLFSHYNETSGKIVNVSEKKDSSQHFESFHKEFTLGKADTSRTYRIIESKSSKGKVLTEKASFCDSLNRTLITASWDTTDIKTGFIARVEYNLKKNTWHNWFLIPETKIERTDTSKTILTVKDFYSVKTKEMSSKEISAKQLNTIPKLQLKLGTDYSFSSSNRQMKYLDLSYTEKFMFLYINLQGGIGNEFDKGLSDLPLHLKGELILPLDSIIF